MASKEVIENLIIRGQVFSQYADINGNVTSEANLNGSLYNIEGIVSADGKILGKMGHSLKLSSD